MKFQLSTASKCLATFLALAPISSQEFEPSGRIVGGVEVNPQFMYPWMVSLHKDGKHYCGGSLYNGNTVITAAHCTVDSETNFEALIHRHNVSKPDSQESGRRYSILKRTNHPEYNEDYTTNDVSIWKLNTTNTTPTGLSLDDGFYGSAKTTLFTIIGWGRTISGGQKSDILLQVKVPTYDNATCVKNYYEKGFPINPQFHICAGYPEGGKDACGGDSGGPMIVMKHNRPVLVGIVSWGIGCGFKDLPGIYSRVSEMRDWILKNVN